MIRVRIPPSPTGYMHVGTARQALFNYAFARQHGGSVILRIEDTDVERSKKEYEDAIFEGLRWLGVTPDESPEVGGSFGPYRQSERMGHYRKALETLLNKGEIFYCSHEAASEEKHTIHWCEDKDKKNHNGILRFATPRDRDIEFTDVIRGQINFNTETLGDFSVARSIESPLYHFAVVVDDELMEISHVIRGEDILPSTPKHILMQEALGYKRPVYAHVPLVLGTDRSKLSKRHGSTSLLEFKEKGYLPEALRNFLALLGWNPGTDEEIFSLEEFVKEFSLEKVQRSGAIFDFAKLDWMNGEYIRMLSLEELYERTKSFLPEAAGKHPKEFISKILALEQPRLKKLSELKEGIEYFFETPQYEKELLRWKKMTDEEITASLDKSISILQKYEDKDFAGDYEQVFWGEIGAGDKGAILWPLRVALSGKKASPGPFDLLAVFGVKEAISRLEKAQNRLTP